ncbi:hypothetical protein HPP92_028854 [Vanilla planifolia]|uniref:Uncharacterized protein n=1 Tax=Vanilla planifolia TaxID=51239 RepID=A0A835P702_VANPL|nr:hypothetical protein HPP92_028854 [Vanilla planifolia]KAG0446426.1 hypothetical protein HPP92_028843 [Vanilla planifolia]
MSIASVILLPHRCGIVTVVVFSSSPETFLDTVQVPQQHLISVLAHLKPRSHLPGATSIPTKRFYLFIRELPSSFSDRPCRREQALQPASEGEVRLERHISELFTVAGERRGAQRRRSNRAASKGAFKVRPAAYRPGLPGLSFIHVS